MIYGKYEEFRTSILNFVDEKFIFTDPLHTLAYGTDASCYRLVPKIVVWVQTASDLSAILKIADNLDLPVCFRAAGTSLSGQAITDSILLVTSRNWKDISVNEDKSLITLAPSVVGADANAFLAPYAKKIGPDPASIGAAMIAGIAANNASGMCCGVADNTYKTMESMKIIFADGTRLDTGNEDSRKRFAKTHEEFLEKVKNLAEKTKENKKLSEKITRKFKIKNTCGYSLNAIVDYEDPIDIISHLMVGSEGTLAFMEEITYKTVPEYSDKASALMIFKTIKDACDAIALMKNDCVDNINAAELMDRPSLRSVENMDGMPSFLKDLGETSTAVLVETRAENSEKLDENIAAILDVLKDTTPEFKIEFTKKASEYSKYWAIRKGLFPAVGAVRELGTTVIIEDVAYPIDRLAQGTEDLQLLFDKYDYKDAIIFGHALDGNLHFVFTQAFETDEEIKRYESFMADVSQQVAVKYDGSLKAEHGTGRNMAPFVELEWGEDAYNLMWDIKNIFDPKGLLNPDVVLSKDSKINLKNFKLMPQSDDLIDKCIECGFCEPKCPSNNITLTPRQRIAANRYMSLLESNGDLKELESFKELYQYDGIETCATCQLCSIACPVNIDTGALTKKLRAKQIGKTADKIAWSMANNYARTLSTGSVLLSAVHGVTSIMPSNFVYALSKGLRGITNDALPQWTTSLPKGDKFDPVLTVKNADEKVVYFSSCINRTMANPKANSDEDNIHEVVIRLLEKAGYEVIIPKNVNELCCGMPFSSKGYKAQGKSKSDELELALKEASEDGKHKILCDMSPCTKTMTQNFEDRLKIYDSVDFIAEFLLEKLDIKQTDEPIVIHTTCSTRKSGMTEQFEKIAKVCSSNVTIPQSVSCCGFAGDRGFTFPELNKSALRHLKEEIPSNVKYAFSTSKTCEIGLSEHSGLEYKSFFYLLDKCCS
ncbi:Predicted D-lactate dehydrogenase, Fe-S protein, FAD/FMN-containing [hydrothermal vent metagenome]|uniref:D-lactate dehydrogenase (cytochrome) n=1 Tax=hydrothermal vent metagenome TaxID=652676 RepID=A0A1W1EBL6_9ZZZZ